MHLYERAGSEHRKRGRCRRKEDSVGHLLPRSLSLHTTYHKFLCRLLGEKRQELLDQANKLRTGLFKIDETREKVEVMSLELEDAKKKVAEFQKQCEEYLVIIVQQKREADEQQKVLRSPRSPLLLTARSSGVPGRAFLPSILGFPVFLLTSPTAPTSAQDTDGTLSLLSVSRPSLPIVRRSLLRRSSARRWPTMPRRI